jgi:NAD(P)-dependent dehydrogenase (short-subunit alcohol dehydrogenase family)
MPKQVAMITGASRGIGRAIALELAANGLSVMLAARTMDELERLAHEIHNNGGMAAAQPCDVQDPAQVRTLFEACEHQLGAPSVLINNAGIAHVVPAHETSDALWNETIGINLTGAFLCCREAIPYFEKSGGGLIINNASIAAVRGFPNFAAYCASKAGLLGFSRALREELREKNIRVSVVMPGATDTPLWDNLSGDWNRVSMMSADHVGKLIAQIAFQPPDLQVEELTIMPVKGAL